MMGECKFYCNFCGKNGGDVLCLIAGRNHVMICDECVELSRDIVGEARVNHNKGCSRKAALSKAGTE